ncbi:hypothetical protein AAY473_005458 [Plecturocebus cupreus]
MGFFHDNQAGLELPTSGDQPALTSQSAEITGSPLFVTTSALLLTQSQGNQANGWKINSEQSNQTANNRCSEVHIIRLGLTHRPGDSRQRRHTGRQRDSFGQRGCFAGAPAWRFPVRSIRDRRARLVPSPQGKQQLEVLRTESFIASTANLGRSGSVGNRRPPKEN